MGSNGLGGIQGELGEGIRNINIGSDLKNIQKQIGNVGGIQGQLQNFQMPGGLQGAGFGGLQNMINTGNPVDVAGITQAAQNQAGRTFQDLRGQTNDQFGALNLGSSSARDAQLNRQASDLAQGVGDTGLIAGVQAGENAANRQLGALGQFGGLRGQDLGALGQAGNLGLGMGNLALGKGQLNLQGQLGKVNAGQNFMNPFMQTFQQGMGMPGFGMQSFGGASGPGRGGGVGGSRMLGASASGGGGGGGGMGGGISRGRFGFASGGQVGRGGRSGQRVDQQDFMSNLLFGKLFHKPPPPQQFAPPPQRSFSGPRREAVAQRGPINPNPKLGGFSKAKTPSPEEFAVKLMQWAANQNFQPSTQMKAAFGQKSIQGMDADNAMRQALSILGRQEGGIIPGPSVPPDTVPILAQGGEGILHVKMMNELRKSSSKDPLIKKMQKLMFSGKDSGSKKACGGAVKKMASGGPVFDAFGGEQTNQSIQALMESLNAGANIPGLAGGENMTITDPAQANQAMGGGGFSQMGVAPMTPEEKLQKERDDAARRVSLIRSAMITGTKGSAESLAPFLAEAEGALQEIDQNLLDQGELGIRQQQADTEAANVEGANEFRGAQADLFRSQAQPQEGPSEEEVRAAQAGQIIQDNFSADDAAGGRINPTQAAENAAAELRARGFEAEAQQIEARVGGISGENAELATLPQNPTEFNTHVMTKMTNGEDLTVEEQQASLAMYANLLRQGINDEEIASKFPALSQIVGRLTEGQ